MQPGRLTLLLGTPGSGRSVLMKALAGRLGQEKTLKVGAACPWLPSRCCACGCFPHYLQAVQPLLHPAAPPRRCPSPRLPRPGVVR